MFFKALACFAGLPAAFCAFVLLSAGVSAPAMAQSPGACSPGQFQVTGGCNICPTGTFNVDGTGSSCNTCPSGQFAPAGSQACFTASPGHFILPGNGAQAPCPAGTFSPSGGFCQPTPAGKFSGPGAAVAVNCPAGTTSYGGAGLCRTIDGVTAGASPLLSLSVSSLDFGSHAPGSSTSLQLKLTNTATATQPGLHLFDLSLLGLSFSGDPDYSLAHAFAPQVLAAGASLFLDVVFEPDSLLPSANDLATLVISTDQGAGFGLVGKSFNVALVGATDANGVPEPGTLALVALALFGLTMFAMRRRSRA